MKKIINWILALVVGILAFLFLSTIFVIIKSHGVQEKIVQTLPPNHLPYYFGFILVSITAVYATIGFINYFEKNFGDVDDIPSSKELFSKNYKSRFLKHHVRIAAVLYVCFLIAGFLVQLRNSELAENFLIGGSILAIFGSIPIAYFLSEKSDK